MTYVLFVPWRNAQVNEVLPAKQLGFLPNKATYQMPGAEYVDKNSKWIRQAHEELKKKKDFIEIFFNGTKHDVLQKMTDGQIYIRGHGVAGQHTIRSGTDLSATRPNLEKLLTSCLGPNDVAQRLQDSGLECTFAGKIKCYNCHSADYGNQDESPFAQVFADVMALKGYRSCTYWGYRGALSSFYDTFDKSATLHKNSTYRGTRASEARMQIFPRT